MEKYRDIHTRSAALYIYLFIYLEMIVPGTAGQDRAAPGEVVVLCALWTGSSHKTSRRATGKGQTGAHEIDFFFFHKMLIILLRLFFLFPTQRRSAGRLHFQRRREKRFNK